MTYQTPAPRYSRPIPRSNLPAPTAAEAVRNLKLELVRASRVEACLDALRRAFDRELDDGFLRIGVGLGLLTALAATIALSSL